MAQLLVRQLNLAVKEALRRRAQAVARDEPSSSHSPGLGNRMAALFAHAGLEEPISEWRGVEAVPAPFEA